MLGNAKVFKAGGGKGNALAIVIPMSLVRHLDINRGNRVEFDLQNPRPNIVEAKTHEFPERARAPSKPTTPPEAIAAEVTEDIKLAQTRQESEVPDDIITQLYASKKKGMHLAEMKTLFDRTDYYWQDLPESVRKHLEAERKPQTPSASAGQQ